MMAATDTLSKEEFHCAPGRLPSTFVPSGLPSIGFTLKGRLLHFADSHALDPETSSQTATECLTNFLAIFQSNKVDN